MMVKSCSCALVYLFLSVVIGIREYDLKPHDVTSYKTLCPPYNADGIFNVCDTCLMAVRCDIDLKCENFVTLAMRLFMFSGNGTCLFGSKYDFCVLSSNELVISKCPSDDACEFSCTARSTSRYYKENEVPFDSSENGQLPEGMANKACRCGWSNRNNKRVSGSEEVGINEYPFMAHIKWKYPFKNICSGTIITNRHVLSSANCVSVRSMLPYYVVVGEHDYSIETETNASAEYIVEMVIIHDEYNSTKISIDIAILLLKDAITFTDRVGPVCVPRVQKYKIRDFAKVLGWERFQTDRCQKSSVLLQKYLEITDLSACRDTVSSFDNSINFCLSFIRRGNISTEGVDYFNGQIVMADRETNLYYLIGQISYGTDFGFSDPIIGLDIVKNLDWINMIITDTSPSSFMCH